MAKIIDIRTRLVTEPACVYCPECHGETFSIYADVFKDEQIISYVQCLNCNEKLLVNEEKEVAETTSNIDTKQTDKEKKDVNTEDELDLSEKV